MLICSMSVFLHDCTVCRGRFVNSFANNIHHDRKNGNLRSIRSCLLVYARNLPNHAQVSDSDYYTPTYRLKAYMILCPINVYLFIFQQLRQSKSIMVQCILQKFDIIGYKFDSHT